MNRADFWRTAGHPPQGVVPLYSQPNSKMIRVRLLPGQARGNSKPTKGAK